MPATDTSLVPVTGVIDRASRPFVLKTIPGRLRASAKSAESKRWLDLRAELIQSLVPGFGARDLTPEARTLVEQVADLQLQSDLLRAAMLRGEKVDPDHTIRLSVATERHLSALRKTKLLKVEPAPTRTREETKPAAPEVMPPATGTTLEAAFTAQGTVYRVQFHNVPPDLANEAGRRALTAELSRQEHLRSRYGHSTDLTSLRVDCRENKHAVRMVQLVRAALGEEG